jgi:hypothetical protein
MEREFIGRAKILRNEAAAASIRAAEIASTAATFP